MRGKREESNGSSSFSLPFRPLSARALVLTFALACSHDPALCSRSKVRGTEEQTAPTEAAARTIERATKSRVGEIRHRRPIRQWKLPSRLSPFWLLVSLARAGLRFSLTLSLHACGPSALDRAARRKQSRRRRFFENRLPSSSKKKKAIGGGTDEKRERSLLLSFFFEEALFEGRAQRRVAEEKGEMDKSTERAKASSCDR